MAESHHEGKTAQVMAIRKQRETGRVMETGCLSGVHVSSNKAISPNNAIIVGIHQRINLPIWLEPLGFNKFLK